MVKIIKVTDDSGKITYLSIFEKGKTKPILSFSAVSANQFDLRVWDTSLERLAKHIFKSESDIIQYNEKCYSCKSYNDGDCQFPPGDMDGCSLYKPE